MWTPNSTEPACRRVVQLLAKHRMPAYRLRLLSIIHLAAPQLLPVPFDSTAGPLHIELASNVADSVSVARATIRLPLLPPSHRDDLASGPQSMHSASSLGSINAERSFSGTHWQLPRFVKTAAGWPQDVPATIEVEGAWLDTVTGARLELPTGIARPAHIEERPASPELLPVSAAWPERMAEPRQSWMQRLLALAAIRGQSDSTNVQPVSASRHQQILQLTAAVPYREAQQFSEGFSKLSLRLRSDWAQTSIELALRPRCVWVVAEQPMDALAFMRQLVPQLPVSTDPGAAPAADDPLQGSTDEVTGVGNQRVSPLCADRQPASAWSMRLRAPIGVLVDMQQRAAGLAAARQPALPLPCICSAGVKYAAVMQDRNASFEARLRSFVMALQERMANNGRGQPPSVLRRLQFTRTSGAQQLDPADGVLVLLQSDRQNGPPAHRFWHMASRPSELEQLIRVTLFLNVPTMVVLLGSGPWSRTMGSDLTRWARRGVSVLHVASLGDNAQATVAGGLLVQHAMYRMLTSINTAELPARAQL